MFNSTISNKIEELVVVMDLKSLVDAIDFQWSRNYKQDSNIALECSKVQKESSMFYCKKETLKNRTA